MSSAVTAPTHRQKLVLTSMLVTKLSAQYLAGDPTAAADREDILTRCHAGLTGLTGDSYEAVKDAYKVAIEHLYEARDAKQGVSRTVKGDVLIRDARKAGPIDKHSGEAIAANYVNLCRAAEVMLDDALDRGAVPAEIDALRKQTRKRAAEIVAAVQRGEKVSGKTLIHLTDEMLKGLKVLKDREGNKVFEDAKKTLDRAKALTNLDDDHRHVVTISKAIDKDGKERAVVESDVMLQGTIPELQEQFQKIIDGNGKEPAWFKKLNKEQQALVRKYAPKLRDGEKVVSSQLFDFVPGLKNAFLKRTHVSKAGHPGELEKVSEVLHAGTPAFAGKGDKKEGTALAVRQARQFAPDGDEFTLHVLNSSANEGRIVNPLKEYAKEEAREAEVDFAPVNPVRRVSHTRHGATDRTLDDLTEKVKGAFEETSPIRKYLEHGETRPWYKPWEKSDKSKAYAFLAEVEKKGDKSVGGLKTSELSAAIRLKASRDRSMGFFKHNNFRISADALVAEFSSALKRTRLLFCKSGKDRTGSVLFKAAFLAVADHLGLTSAAKSGNKAAEKNMSENLQFLVDSGHTQYMAGGPGGTIGAFGVKPETAARAPDKTMRSVSDRLGLKSADRNKVKRRKKLFRWFGPKKGADAVAKGIIARTIGDGAAHATTTHTTPGAGIGRGKRGGVQIS